MSTSPELTVLYDGGCPLCVREVKFLRRRDRHQSIRFIDVDAQDYCPDEWSGISYRQAMAKIHAIQSDGTVLTDVAVFREAYRLIGLGWLEPSPAGLTNPTYLPTYLPTSMYPQQSAAVGSTDPDQPVSRVVHSTSVPTSRL